TGSDRPACRRSARGRRRAAARRGRRGRLRRAGGRSRPVCRLVSAQGGWRASWTRRLERRVLALLPSTAASFPKSCLNLNSCWFCSRPPPWKGGLGRVAATAPLEHDRGRDSNRKGGLRCPPTGFARSTPLLTR